MNCKMDVRRLNKASGLTQLVNVPTVWSYNRTSGRHLRSAHHTLHHPAYSTSPRALHCISHPILAKFTMLRRHSSVDEPTPLLLRRRFLIPHLIHPKAPLVSEWLEEVTDPFAARPVDFSPPVFCRRHLDEETNDGESLAEYTAEPQKSDVAQPIPSHAQAYAEIVRPVYFDGPGVTEKLSGRSIPSAGAVRSLLSILLSSPPRGNKRALPSIALIGFAFVAGYMCQSAVARLRR